MEQVSYVVFGWVLGLIGGFMGLIINNYYRRRNLRSAIHSELIVLAKTLIEIHLRIFTHQKNFNKETFKWQYTYLSKYQMQPELVKIAKKVIDAPEQEQQKAFTAFAAVEGESLGLKKYSTRFFDTIIGDISLFEPQFQNDILEIIQKVDIFNEEVEEARFSHRLTFDPNSMNVNANYIKSNIHVSYQYIQKHCETIVDKIDEIL